MRVKRLEIQGFKSFKDKTVVHFDHSITGIVGPNGCGKSNIVDAFFWVMGEQSYKHMRGSSSDDLIFNGSSRYNPLGMAEATLVMETDVPDTANAPAGATLADIPVHLRSKEVSVTRRLYRGGEGEYFINGVPARLKDIHELFMDTGVGAKGYSIIEQGQIGKIVNAKPEDRRLLIEEAAGIAKYKARKKESLRKMEATQGNLSRLNDVIAEIERNLNSLERQAQKARQYKKYKDELLDKEMTWGRRKALVTRQRLESLKKERDALEQLLAGMRAELQIAENSIETDRVAQLTDTKAAEELQTQIQLVSDDLARERSALELSRRRQSDLTAQRQTLESEKTDLLATIESEKQSLAAKEAEALDADRRFAEAAEQASSMDSRARELRQQVDTLRREVDASKRELMQSIQRASELNSRSASLASKMESAQAEVLRAEEQTQTHEERLSIVRGEVSRAQTAAEELRTQRESLSASVREQRSKVQSHHEASRESEKNRDSSLRLLTQLKSRLQSLEELAAAHEGFGDGPKAALDWAKSHGGKLLALADTLEVSAGYESAVEGLLESRLESLVAEEASFALQAIAQVRESRSGRVAIHVGSQEIGPTVQEPSRDFASYDSLVARLSENGFKVIGKLTDLVKTSHIAAARAIAEVVLVESFAEGSDFISNSGASQLQGWTLLALDGSVLEPSGLIRGGTTVEEGEGSLLRHRRAIAELRNELVECESSHAQAEQAAENARALHESATERLQTLQADLQTAEVQMAALERDVHQNGRALREAESQLQATQRELERARESLEQAQMDRTVVENSLVELVSRREELESAIVQSDSDLLARDTELRTHELEANSLRVNEASLRERSVSLRRELESGNSLLQHRERRVGEIDRVLERTTREHDEFSGSETSLEEKISDLTRQVATSRDELAILKDRLEASGAKLNVLLDRIKELHHAGDERSSQSTQLALETEKLNSDLAHLIQNLEEKYGPGCLERPVTSPIQEEMTEPVITAEMTAEEEVLLGEEVERLRERIRRLGEVNVSAIEEFEEVKKRYDYLVTERSDLERSIQNLQDAIEHINKTSENRFSKAFEAISQRFERLFPIIFGGGQAKLSLVYPEGSTEILDAGVDILAQPPGKKIVNIGLLSGGEKALTAVSLIFAIFMVKPSPFCVLDEVDAPLDDANIGKFNALLREMSSNSQFILITHNKKTMELNDTLYGVTMEEPGVSKMVSIEMR
jgi:chromosome segregation protein